MSYYVKKKKKERKVDISKKIPDYKEVNSKNQSLLKNNYFELARKVAEECPKLLVSKKKQYLAFKGRRKDNVLSELIRPCQDDCYVNICSPEGCSVVFEPEELEFFTKAYFGLSKKSKIQEKREEALNQ